MTFADELMQIKSMPDVLRKFAETIEAGNKIELVIAFRDNNMLYSTYNAAQETVIGMLEIAKLRIFQDTIRDNK
jgi:hypothetical protein